MKNMLLGALAVLTLGTISASGVGKTTLTAYGSYWNQTDDAYGGGLKLAKSLVDIIYLDGRAGYMNNDTAQTTMVPLEASLNLGLPGMITPYVGVGAGYYLIDSDFFDSVGGYYGQLGVEFIFTKFGASAELRYLDLEGSYFDGTAFNLGLLWKF